MCYFYLGYVLLMKLVDIWKGWHTDGEVHGAEGATISAANVDSSYQ
jgi:hypothetical protein